MTTLVWYEDDLRLADHMPLQMAVREAGGVLPVFVLDTTEDAWSRGAASRWWLHHSLAAHRDALAEHGVELVLEQGDPVEVLGDLVDRFDVDTVRSTRRYRPHARERDERVHAVLEEADVEVALHAERVLHDPDAIETTSGGPYHVFTPFYERLKRQVEVGRPLSPPPSIDGVETGEAGVELEALGLLSDVERGEGLGEAWTPGEAGARDRIDRFVEEALARYPDDRDRPDLDGTSRLSAHLTFGEISVREAWVRIRQAEEDELAPAPACQAFLRQLAWREFAYHLLWHYPGTTEAPLRDAYAGFPWRQDPEHLDRWQQGLTGYPFVDAGMRQLSATGWMHNRVRMVVASFLTKHLLLPWQAGARWFWGRLVDADLANNTLGWQWAAGCGADAQPYVRIFNPITQGERHDPDGVYTRRWVPELADLPHEHLHAPWRAPDEVLAEAGVMLGVDYPEPIVEHAVARERALAAYKQIR